MYTVPVQLFSMQSTGSGVSVQTMVAVEAEVKVLRMPLTRVNVRVEAKRRELLILAVLEAIDLGGSAWWRRLGERCAASRLMQKDELGVDMGAVYGGCVPRLISHESGLGMRV